LPDLFGGRLAYVLPGTAAGVIDAIEDVPENLRYVAAIGIRPGARVNVTVFGLLARQVTVMNAAGRHAISIEQPRLSTVDPEATAKPQSV
jgi:hypothetical protein